MPEPCVDRLDALLAHFPIRAQMFHAGHVCGPATVSEGKGQGQLHLLRSGRLKVIHSGQAAMEVQGPSLLLYPRPLPRTFFSEQQDAAELVCADVCFEAGKIHPIAQALPEFLCLSLTELPELNTVLSIIFQEAFGDLCGRKVMIDRLFEVVVVHVMRHLMERQPIPSTLLAGMSHPKLRKALVAIHEQPQRSWTLERLAQQAGMSRTVFTSSFRHSVGCTPGYYLQQWRIQLAQKALLSGQPLKQIAEAVGYRSEAALSRAFRQHCGVSPMGWKKAQSS